jgi:hypothetical protein
MSDPRLPHPRLLDTIAHWANAIATVAHRARSPALSSRMKRVPTETLERWAYIAAIVGVPLFLISLVVAYIQIRDVVRVAKLQNTISLNAEFFNPSNTAVISAMEKHKPILIENGGTLSNVQLDNFLGDFETIASAYNQDLLSEDDLCISFSYYADEAGKNAEIQKYIHRKENSDFFAGFVEIVKTVQHSKDANCQ